MSLAVSIAQSGANNVTMRNRIINGNMMIDQRNAGASISIPSSGPKYATDRFFGDNASAGSAVYSLQQVSDAPAGFNFSLRATVTTAASVAAGDYQYIRQAIEGFNFADFQFGTSAAQTFTLSFWVKSSLTGTFGGYLGAASNARFRVFTYTINSANTWEYKTVTITGDTAGTWAGATNGVGLQVAWSLACGTTYLGATGSWSSSIFLGATGQTNITATNGATFYITGVQLEEGTTATAFEQRLYGTELQLCQRYYFQLGGETLYQFYGMGVSQTSTTCGVFLQYPVPMRSAPSFFLSNVGNTIVLGPGGTKSPTGYSLDQTTTTNIQFSVTGMTGVSVYDTYQYLSNNSTLARLTFSAEL